jgi:flagellar basal body-associated protein FliL
MNKQSFLVIIWIVVITVLLGGGGFVAYKLMKRSERQEQANQA